MGKGCYKWKRKIALLLIFVLLISALQNTGFKVSASEQENEAADMGSTVSENGVAGQDIATGQDDKTSQAAVAGQDGEASQNTGTEQSDMINTNAAAMEDAIDIQNSTETQNTTVEYQFFKDGEKVDTKNTEQTDKDYDGYVKVQTTGLIVTVTAVAKDGYEFMMLDLLTGDGWLTTPLSKDYVKSGDGTKAKTEGNYSYTFTVDSGQSTAITQETIGSVYAEMPGIKAYFDVKGSDENLLNDDLLGMNTVSSVKNSSGDVFSWFDLGNQLNAGTEAWGEKGGYDIKKNDYVVYDAGEGKTFDITGISMYGRWRFAFDRFEVDIFGSNDSNNYEEVQIVDTKWLEGDERTKHLYSIRRHVATIQGQYRYLKIKADCNITNISLLKIYGSVKVNTGGEVPEEPEDKAKTSYLLFKDGSCIETVDALEKATVEYDGYVKKEHIVASKTVTITPVAAEGYEFAILNLKDSGGRVMTPVSCAYKHKEEWTTDAVNGNDYDFTYMYGADSNGSNNVYNFKEEPVIYQAYFDKKGNLNIGSMNGTGFTGYEKMFNGKIAAGSKGWS